MPVYTQLHQITDAMGRNIDLDPMIDDCIAGMQERDRQNEEPVRTEAEARAEIEAAIKAKAQELRRQAYQAEADPLYMRYQRGEAEKQEWLDKVEEIRGRYPYPDDSGE